MQNLVTEVSSSLPSAHPFRLVVFDMDGTLVDSQHVIAEAMAIAFADQGFEPPPPTAVKRVVGLHLEEAIARLLDEAAESAVDALAARYRQAFFASRSRPHHVEPLFPGVR